MRRLFRAGLFVLLAAGCMGPSRTVGDYREKAANAAEAMISVVETARLTAEAAKDGKAFSRYLSLVLSESESAASSIRHSFVSVQPPGDERVDELRDELRSLLDESAAALGDMRIAARRGDARALEDAAERLPGLRHQLTSFQRLATT